MPLDPRSYINKSDLYINSSINNYCEKYFDSICSIRFQINFRFLDSFLESFN